MHSFTLRSALVFLLTISIISYAQGGNIPLPLGIVFEQGTPEVQTAFKHALLTFTLNITTNPRDVYRFTAYVDTINTADAFKLSKLICNQFSRGIYAMVGSMNPESFATYHAFANTFHMPLITPWYPSKESPASVKDHHSPSRGQNAGRIGGELPDYTTRLRPDFNPGILDTIRHYGWKDIIYLYSTNEGLLRLQTLFYRASDADNALRVKLVKKINSVKDAIAVLRENEAADRFSQKYILLDCPTSMAKEIIISHVRDVHLGRRTYHYLLAGLAFDEPWERNILEFNAVNITGFRMIDPTRRYVKDFLQKWSSLDTNQFAGAGKDTISANAAFMYDAMLIIKESFSDILTDNPFTFNRYGAESACDSGSDFLDDIRPFEYGQTVNQHLRRVQTEGLTGNIQFHENGTRKYFSVDVMELGENCTKVKIGQWSDFAGFREESLRHNPSHQQTQDTDHKKVYVISTILEEPFLKKPLGKKSLTGNDMYEGYIKDLADILFSKLGLKYRIQLVRDGKYGSKISSPFGETWNGIVGELVRKEVDLAIAPLTVTSDRERVIDFTEPFLHQGISIMTYKPRKQFPGMFSFMKPLSDLVWISVLGAYLTVSGVLYLIYRLTTAHQRQHLQRSTENNSKYANSNSNQHQHQEHSSHAVVHNSSGSVPKTQGTLSNFLWMSFSILSHNRGTSITSNSSIAARLASTVWWIFALILVSVYTGNYIALRVKNKVSTPIRSAWDLVDRGGIQYGTLESGATFDFFKNSENQVYRAMFEHMSGPNQQNVQTYEEGINTVRQKKGKYAFILESTKIEYINNQRPCNTVKVGPDLADIHYAIGLPVGSPFTQKLNQEILKLEESGALRKLEEKWWLNKAECAYAAQLDKMDASTTDDELSLVNLAGIFYILIIGMVIAVFVAFFEFFCSSRKDTSKPKVTTTETTIQRNTTLIDSVPTDFCDIPPPDMNSK